MIELMMNEETETMNQETNMETKTENQRYALRFAHTYLRRADKLAEWIGPRLFLIDTRDERIVRTVEVWGRDTMLALAAWCMDRVAHRANPHRSAWREADAMVQTARARHGEHYAIMAAASATYADADDYAADYIANGGYEAAYTRAVAEQSAQIVALVRAAGDALPELA
jgi:hypothetical protein